MSELSVIRTELANGVVVLLDQEERSETVTLTLSVRGGLRSENETCAGITHVLEHVLFRRTAQRDSRNINRQIDALGGDVNGFTDVDGMYLYASVPRRKCTEALTFLSELLLESSFTDDDVALEKDIIRQEILDAQDSPAVVVHEAFCGEFWKDTQLGLPVYGTLESVAAVDREMLRELHKELLCGSRLVVTIAGGLEVDAVMQVVEDLFASMPRGTFSGPANAKTHRGLVKRPLPVGQSYVLLGVPWPSLTDEAYYDGLIVSHMLGEMMSSRLFQKIREERGLAYDVASEVDAHRDTAGLLLSATLEPKNLQAAIDVLLSECADLASTLREDELLLARESMLAQLDLSHDSISTRMWRCVESEFSYGRYISPQEVREKLQVSSFGEVRAFCDTWLAPGTMCASLGGELDSFELKPSLSKWCGGAVG